MGLTDSREGLGGVNFSISGSGGWGVFLVRKLMYLFAPGTPSLVSGLMVLRTLVNFLTKHSDCHSPLLRFL